MNEAIELGTVSVAKRGCVCTLEADVSICATMNPRFRGYFKAGKSLKESTWLEEGTLERFDKVLRLEDKCDEVQDECVIQQVISNFDPDHARTPKPPLSIDEVKTFIEYARKRRPKLSDESKTALKEAFLDLRGRAAGFVSRRTLWSLLRWSEAFSKAELGENVTKQDVTSAAEFLLESLNEDDWRGKAKPVASGGSIDAEGLDDPMEVDDPMDVDM